MRCWPSREYFVEIIKPAFVANPFLSIVDIFDIRADFRSTTAIVRGTSYKWDHSNSISKDNSDNLPLPSSQGLLSFGPADDYGCAHLSVLILVSLISNQSLYNSTRVRKETSDFQSGNQRFWSNLSQEDLLNANIRPDNYFSKCWGPPYSIKDSVRRQLVDKLSKQFE